MKLELLHFYNEDKEQEYIVLTDREDRKRKQEFVADASNDGYNLLSCIEFDGDITLPINSILSK